MAEIIGGNLGERTLETETGERIRTTCWCSRRGAPPNSSATRASSAAFCLHHLNEALELRNHTLAALERADASSGAACVLLGFVVVGVDGVELAGRTLAEMRRRVLPTDFPDLAGGMRVTLLEGRDRLLAGMPPSLSSAPSRRSASSWRCASTRPSNRCRHRVYSSWAARRSEPER